MFDATESLTKEDTAFLLKLVWEALLLPNWTKDDLIDLGKDVHFKTPLAKISDKKFNRLFPSLKIVAETIGNKYRARLLEEIQDQLRFEVELAQASSLEVVPTPTTPTAPAAPAAPISTAATTPLATPTPPTTPAAPAALATPTDPATSASPTDDPSPQRDIGLTGPPDGSDDAGSHVPRNTSPSHPVSLCGNTDQIPTPETQPS